MVQFKVEYYKKKCIGAGTCAAVSPDYWEMEPTGKAKMKGGFTFNEQTQMFEKIIDEKDLEAHKRAADGCPKNVIHITNLETGEKII